VSSICISLPPSGATAITRPCVPCKRHAGGAVVGRLTFAQHAAVLIDLIDLPGEVSVPVATYTRTPAGLLRVGAGRPPSRCWDLHRLRYVGR